MIRKEPELLMLLIPFIMLICGLALLIGACVSDPVEIRKCPEPSPCPVCNPVPYPDPKPPAP